MLRPGDLRSLPKLAETIDMLKPGVPLAFCMGAVMTTVVSATNLATGARRSKAMHDTRDEDMFTALVNNPSYGRSFL